MKNVTCIHFLAQLPRTAYTCLHIPFIFLFNQHCQNKKQTFEFSCFMVSADCRLIHHRTYSTQCLWLCSIYNDSAIFEESYIHTQRKIRGYKNSNPILATLPPFFDTIYTKKLGDCWSCARQVTFDSRSFVVLFCICCACWLLQFLFPIYLQALTLINKKKMFVNSVFFIYICFIVSHKIHKEF